jgi:hypothetical protein
MSDEIERISEKNLSVAWGRAFLRLMDHGGSEVSPLVIQVTGLEDGTIPETPAIRKALDEALDEQGAPTCDTTARLIFPRSLWNPKLPRAALYDRYLNILPEIRKCMLNNYGVYFERMIAFGGKINQLEQIIQMYKYHSHRRSALQAAIFDPSRDHSFQPRRVFPCLQQVAFSPTSKGLSVTGFYPMQYLVKRAYGNYLGLCWLGQFMAHELGLPLAQMQCFVGVGKLDNNKSDLKSLADRVMSSL